jgi:hypothetical protein
MGQRTSWEMIINVIPFTQVNPGISQKIAPQAPQVNLRCFTNYK